MQALKIFRISVFAFALALSGLPSFAGTLKKISFTTYLREGPGVRYRVIDEAETGLTVNVGACSEGWCLVSYEQSSGYVAQNMIEDMRSAPLKNAHCATNREAGYHGSDTNIICTAPAKP